MTIGRSCAPFYAFLRRRRHFLHRLRVEGLSSPRLPVHRANGNSIGRTSLRPSRSPIDLPAHVTTQSTHQPSTGNKHGHAHKSNICRTTEFRRRRRMLATGCLSGRQTAVVTLKLYYYNTM